jgi:prepilin-type N-terminal cleavage/methylation domain-containing protein
MKKGFTIAEILVVLAIAGIIMITGVTPLMYTVRSIRDAQRVFADDNRERNAVSRMTRDMMEAVWLNAPSPFRIMHDDKLEMKNSDYLMIWTKTPSYELNPMGSVVYGIPEDTVLSSLNARKGLYRWVLSADKQLDSITREDLKSEEGRLVLPGVIGVAFSALKDSDWENDYSGAIPRAFRVEFNYDGTDRTYERWLPKI